MATPMKNKVVAMASMLQSGSCDLLARTGKPELNAHPDAMAQALSAGGMTRATRVNILRWLIATGTYRVSSSDLAANLQAHSRRTQRSRPSLSQEDC
jgi:hypothetical protein